MITGNGPWQNGPEGAAADLPGVPVSHGPSDQAPLRYDAALWALAGRYRGVYEWDGSQRAGHYARALWRVLALVSVRGSIHYMILPGLRRDEFLAHPQALAGTTAAETAAWWRPAEVL